MDHSVRFISLRQSIRCFLPVIASSRIVPRSRGWMERRQAHSFFLLSRVRGATPALVRRGPSRCDRDPFRRSTVALSSCGPTLPFRQWDTGSGSDCPRQAMNAWRSGSEPPAVRFAPQPRDATPGSVSRIVSGRRPLLSQDANLIAHIRYVVNIFLRIVVIILVAKATRKRPGSPCKPCELRNRSAGMRPVRYEQQRPVIASATRSSSLSRSCAWSCA